MLSLFFVICGMLSLAYGELWLALVLFCLAVSVRITLTALLAALFVIVLFSMQGCSSFGPQMSELNYKNGQSFSTSPCGFWVGDTCVFR